VPRSLVLPDPIPETTITPESVLLLLAQLPGHYLKLYSSKEFALTVKSDVHLENIYIPPLIKSLRVISKNDGVNSSEVSADLYLYVEDRHLDVTKIKNIATIKESYDLNMRDTVNDLLEKVKEKKFD
jgi:hypothetical protein